MEGQLSRQAQVLIMLGALAVAILALGLQELVVLPVDERPHVGVFVVFSLVCAALTAAVLLVGIPAAERATGTVNRLAQIGFVVSLVGLATIIVYWTAIPFVLGTGGAVMGRLGDEWAARKLERRGSTRRDEPREGEDGPRASERATQGWTAAVMGGLTFLACLVIFVVDLLT